MDEHSDPWKEVSFVYNFIEKYVIIFSKIEIFDNDLSTKT